MMMTITVTIVVVSQLKKNTGDPSVRDGDESASKCLSPRVLCLPAVRPQVIFSNAGALVV